MPKYSEAQRQAVQELTVQWESGYLSIPALLGPVGIGKTDMAQELAIEMSSKMDDSLIFEPIATGEASDPTDTSGIPWVITVDDPNGEATKKDYRVLWALNRAAYQACRMPTLLLFDDIDKATNIVVNSLLNLFVHRRFKDFALHPKSLMMTAGNRTQDDIHANRLSESLRTRMTIIEVEADFEDFANYAKKTGNIHDHLIGFLTARPELLHKHEENVYRFPTPRGYREASLHMWKYPESDWPDIVERKLGKPVRNDFVAWHKILSKVDVEHILRVGYVKDMPTDIVGKKMMEFAAIFALTMHLNKKDGVQPGWAGFDPYIDSLKDSPEMKIAFLLQLTEKARSAVRQLYPTAAGKIMATVIADEAAGP
jgi:hypothetical protein